MSRLVVTGLTKRFGGVTAVDGLDLTVAAGEMVALIGPNGAGKSTSFNAINGQLRPDAGTVRLDGREVTGLPPHLLARLGVGRTFQVAAVFASMTVAENVGAAVLAARGATRAVRGRADPAAVAALLERVGLSPRSDAPCATLAYGDLKRLELALALAGEPRLILMDEPTAGMAGGERTTVMTLTREVVAATGAGVLFTEHDMDAVFAFADRVLVLDQGRLIAGGPPAAVRGDPNVRAVYLGEDAA